MTDDNGGRRRKLVIVESPAKARTIARYLPDYVVESSIGHVRDLPSTAAEIPANVKKEPWARLGVNVDEGFEPLYVVPAGKRDQVKKLKALLKSADELYLATDEDREGEAIAWHLTKVLDPRVPVKRMVFHEITRRAIEEALEHTRDIDQELVDAQEARRIFDRLYGYEVSPVLWKKIRPRLSAGRVQSVAVRLIVDRERARMRFHAAGFWDVEATLVPDGGDPALLARLAELDGRRVASGRDFDPESGELASADVRLLDETTAQTLATALRPATFIVSELAERPYTQRPAAPFITSTLQQEAGRKLRFTAQRTMRVAQGLYENGYITYMRTDSTILSEQAVTAARQQARSLYGADHVPDQPRQYASRSPGAQEAHEAIRPAGERFRTVDDVRAELGDEARRLYELIWKRTVASQMKDATGLRTTVRLEADGGDLGTAVLSASGKVITFAGFLRAYVEGSDDPDAELEDQERLLPPLRRGQELAARHTEAKGHQTQPPARFTEASLVRELEARGIGRPSTYASIIQTVQDRGYVSKRGTALVPTFVAFAVTRLLEEHFGELVSLEFTARMENRLDAVATGEIDAKPWLTDFYFGGGNTVDEDTKGIGLKARIASGVEAIDAREVSSIPLGEDADGRLIAARVGRYGPYVQAGNEDLRATIPDDMAPDEVTLERALELLADAARGDEVLGHHPDGGLPVYVKSGRYGPYVQLGEDSEDGDHNPKRASLWPGMTPQSITMADAELLLSYPRTLGMHPDTGEAVTAQDGPNGPYLRTGDESRSLRDHDHLRAIELEEAVRILAEPRQARRSGPAVLNELGEHPDSKEPVRVLRGRFGPYASDGTVNATIPNGRDPLSITLDDAVDLIAAREQKLRDEGKDPRAPKKPRRRTSTARRKKSA